MTKEQEPLYELLEFFADFCKKHELKYWLVGGTLLGAVRHKGFIPWDDDIDVAMPEEDYRRFLTLKNVLPKPYYIQSEEDDQYYPFLFAKLCDMSKPFLHNNRRGPIGLYIDIFPFEYCKRPTFLQRLKFNAANVISYVLQIKMEWAEDIPYKNLFARIAYYFFCMQSVARLKSNRIKLLDSIKSKAKSDYFISSAGTYKAYCEFYPVSWFRSDTLMEFEGQMLSVPCGWNECLSRNYGNYLIMPPENERVAKHRKP